MTTAVTSNGIDVDSTLKRVDELKDKSLRLPQPAGYKMLVALPKIEEKTAGGIIKASSTIEQETNAANVGFVISLGADAYKDKGKFPNGAWCKEGDFVVMRSYSGTRMYIDGEEFRMLNDDAIEGVVADPRGFSRAI
jgi:co-chaperonin GroES (HSP10)